MNKLYKRYKCRYCKDRGLIKIKQRLEKKNLSETDRAELLVNGGYAYKLVDIPCPNCKMRKLS